jgi:hypothetical protein
MMVPKEKELLEMLQKPFKWVCSSSRCRKVIFTQENLPVLKTEVTNVIRALIDNGTLNHSSHEITWK